MEKKKIEIIPENWEAIEALEKQAIEKTGDPNASFNANLFHFGNRNLLIPILYKKTIRGKETKKYFELQTVANFCPFTGKPLFRKVDI